MAGFHSVSDRRDLLKAALAASVLSPFAAACSPGERGTGLVLGDQVSLGRTRLEAAGELRGLAYDIKWANFAGAAPLLEALNAGAVDTAPAGDLPVILAAAAGCRLKIVAVNKSSPHSMAVIARKGTAIASIADLRRKTVIVSSARGSIAHYLLLEALAEAGIPPAALEIGFMLPNEAASAFSTGQIDAWATFGTYLAKAEIEGARVIRDGAGIGPGYTLIAVGEAALGDPEKRAAIADYLARAARASRWSGANKAAYAQIYARQTGVDPAIAKIAVDRETPGLGPPDAAFVTALQTAADRFHIVHGVLPRRVDIARLVEPGLIAA